MRKGCECDCYATTEGVRDLICKHCGPHAHDPFLLVPTCCVEADVHGPITKQLLRDIFHNRSDKPTKPKLELGPLLTEVVGAQASSQVVMESPVRSPSRSRLDRRRRVSEHRRAVRAFLQRPGARERRRLHRKTS